MADDVAVWQNGIESDAGEKENGPAGYLFDSVISVVANILRIIATGPETLDPTAYELLRNEFRKFYFWNCGFSTQSGELDNILASSQNFRAVVLTLLVEWTLTLSKVPQVLSGYDWSDLSPMLAELQVHAGKVDQVARAVTIETKNRYHVIRNVEFESDSNSDSDFSSISTDETFEDLIDEMSVYMENLTCLAPSLEHVAEDSLQTEPSPILVDDLGSVIEPARPFIIIIKDRFPSIAFPLARKLGETNWLRRERLWEKLTNVDTGDVMPDNSRSRGDTATEAPSQSHPEAGPPESVVSGFTLPSVRPSITTASGVTDVSLFDTNSILPHSSGSVPVAESITSFATSTADPLGIGQRRVPRPPENHNFQTPFRCQICGTIQTNLRNMADWKNHVYRDLEPYICLFPDCPLGLHTFYARRDWMNHEFQTHRVKEEWACNVCEVAFDYGPSLLDHLELRHQDEFARAQVEGLTTWRRTVSRAAIEEQCPFCLVCPARTQKGYARHVGRHLQEISLAAVPVVEPDSNGEEDSDDSDGDDSDDNDVSDKGEDDDIRPGDDGVDGSQKSDDDDDKTVKDHDSIPDSILSASEMSSSEQYSRLNAAESLAGGDTNIGSTKESSQVQDQKKEAPSQRQPLVSSNGVLTIQSSVSRALSKVEFDNQIKELQKALISYLSHRKIVMNISQTHPSTAIHLYDLTHSIQGYVFTLDETTAFRAKQVFSDCIQDVRVLEKGLTPRALVPGIRAQTDIAEDRSSPLIRLRKIFEKAPILSKSDEAPKRENLAEQLSGILERVETNTCLLHKIFVTETPSTLAERSLIHEAARCGNADELYILTLRLWSDIDNNIVPHGTALHVAARSGHTSAVEQLLEAGANINAPNNEEGGALQIAAFRGHKDVVSLLCGPQKRTQANVNLGGGIYGSALQAAAAMGHGKIVEILLNSGASINIRGGKHNTVLRAAMDNKHQGLVRYLVRMGAVRGAAPHQNIINNGAPEEADYQLPSVEIWPDKRSGGDLRSCDRCGEILANTISYGLDAKRWHPACFRCRLCSMIMDGDESVALLSDGDKMCRRCTEACSICHNKTTETGSFNVVEDYVVCENCFQCGRFQKNLHDADVSPRWIGPDTGDNVNHQQNRQLYCANCTKKTTKKKEANQKMNKLAISLDVAGTNKETNTSPASSSSSTFAQRRSLTPTPKVASQEQDLVLQKSPLPLSSTKDGIKSYGSTLRYSNTKRDPSVAELLASMARDTPT